MNLRAPSDGSIIPTVEFRKYSLANGLEVILHEDHSTPIACVNLWYHVGSKNESPGRTGFAHLFEHMMFQGSKHNDRDYFGPLQQVGARVNGSTSVDRTNYWETVPSNYLELALWMESDRMGFLIPAMTDQKLETQREVVKNERRQSYENRPYGLVHEVLIAAMYPAGHPYSWPTIGMMKDIEAASREDISGFFHRYYHPANATLCVAGDVDPAATAEWIERYFGPIPPGLAANPIRTSPVRLAGETRIRMTDKVGLARIHFNWHTVPFFTSDDAELDILADLLAGGKSSRLYQALVKDLQIAQDVRASQRSSEIAGSFLIAVTARPGQNLADVEKAVEQQIARIQQTPPTDLELQRALNRYESHFVVALDSISGFGGRADRLNLYNHYTGDPGFVGGDFQRYQKLTPESIQRVTQRYLNDDRVVLEVLPGQELALDPDPRAASDRMQESLAEPEVEPAHSHHAIIDSFDRSRPPAGDLAPEFVPPTVQSSRFSNGMDVLFVEDNRLPVVYLSLCFPFGRSAEGARRGAASLVAAVLDEGTATRSGTQIAEELGGIGASLSLSCGLDTTVVRLFSLKRHFATAREILEDVLLHPSFGEAEIDTEKGLAVSRLARMRDEPAVLAALARNAILYGREHPYGRPHVTGAAQLQALSRDELVDCYHANYTPNQSRLLLVGEVPLEEVDRISKNALGNWRSTAKPPEFEPPTVPAAKPCCLLIDKPKAAQSVIVVTRNGYPRSTDDYFALLVMNGVFGGQFSSRLNLNLREDKGFTYGARSSFGWRVHDRGTFAAQASVETAVTVEALREILREIEEIAQIRPITDEELEFNQSFIARGYPTGFETSSSLAGKLELLAQYGLPTDYYHRVIPSFQAVTLDQLNSLSEKFFRPAEFSIIVVGDRASLELPLQQAAGSREFRIVEFDEDFQMQTV